MPPPPQRITATFLAVAEYLVDRPEGAYGFEIMTSTGSYSGSISAVLRRLARAGWATMRLVQGHGHGPARCVYTLTPLGAEQVRAILAQRRPPQQADAA